MKLTAIVAVAALGAAVSGCATVFEGTSQEITVVTNPPGASCSFERQGMQVGAIAKTPGTANIRKSKYDIIVKCDKPGYQQGQYLDHSGVSAAIAGNVAADLLLTWGVSSIVDSADGADNKYESAVNMTLLPIPGQEALSALPPPSPFPVHLSCDQPGLQTSFVQEGPFGFVSAKLKFDINTSDDAAAVHVAPGEDAHCRVTAQPGTALASVSLAFDGGQSWTAGGRPARDIEKHVEIVDSPPTGSPATGQSHSFTVRAKDATQGKITLSVPVRYR